MPILGQQRSQEEAHEALNALGLDPENIPQHIACVMDGNGRWAEKQGKPRVFGHQAGAKVLRQLIRGCAELGVKYFSVYAFSTENWSRPKTEVSFLMKLFEEMLSKEIKQMHKEGARVRFSGRLDALNALKPMIDEAQALTNDNQMIQFNIMVNYGGRQEIVDGVNAWLAERKGNEPFTESDMQSHLYVSDAPDPDLWIRSSGEHRLSNYMLWQAAYSELVFEPTLWPDFTFDTLVNCVRTYQERNRRFGGL